MLLSRTFRRTNKGTRIDWLPKNSYYIKSIDEIEETEEELIKFIDETPVYPVPYTYEARIYKFDDETGEPYFVKEFCQSQRWVNLNAVNTAKQKLEVVQWVKKYPHRAKDFGDTMFHGYSKNPSHWNHDFCIVPGRARTRMKLKDIKKGILDPDDVCWDDYKKPCPYYW